jgi:hypothetical protein
MDINDLAKMPGTKLAYYKSVNTTKSNYLMFSYAFDIAFEKMLADLFFNGDLSRIIYSGNNYCFRKRSRNNQESSLDLPFINYKLVSTDKEPMIRSNYPASRRGIYIEELGTYVKYLPVTLSYEITFWSATDYDARVADALWSELRVLVSKLQYGVEINQKFLPLIGIFKWGGIDFEPEYEEQDWLEKEKIHSVAVNLDIETFQIWTPANFKASVPESLILDFVTQKRLVPSGTIVEKHEELINEYFSEEE